MLWAGDDVGVAGRLDQTCTKRIELASKRENHKADDDWVQTQ